jgi:hypothetical protein
MAGKMKTGRILTDEEVVESRLRHFINKYYRIKIFQGILISISAALIIFFALIILVNILDISKTFEKVIIFISIALFAGIAGKVIFEPLFQRMGWIRGLNFKEASRIIQEKHHSIEDRIINVIELAHEKKGKNNKLYDYAISQKADNIRKFNFDDAISMRKLGLFLIRFGVIAAVSTGLYLIRPDFVRKGIGQILAGSEASALNGRSQFHILNDSLEVEAGKDYLLRFQVTSDFQVENVSVKFGSVTERADAVTDGYQYLFKAVNSNVSFRLTNDGELSGEYVLKTLKKPEISGLQLKIIPPGYTGMESLVTEGDGNAEVPGGSLVVWNIRTVNTDEMQMNDESGLNDIKGKNGVWNLEKRITKNSDYEFICRNRNGLITNYNYKITVVKDLFPTVDISESRDSTISNDVYVQGIIQDDYGFSKLELIESKTGKEIAKKIEIKENNIYEQFYYTLVPDSNNTVYFFRIWDNDHVTGPKYTDSRKISLRTMTKQEIQNVNNQLADSISKRMSDGMTAIEKMEKKISEFKMEQVVGELKPWEIQEKLKELNQLKNNVVDFLNNISKANKEFTENEMQLNLEEELTEKAKQIQDLMQGLMDDELKDLLKEFEELEKQYNAAKAEELADKMELNLEKLKEQMEMSLELFKKYDMEKDLMKQVEELNKMADSLQSDNQERKDSAGQLKEEFKKWEKKYDETVKQDQELKKPMGLKDLENERDEVRKAADELEKSGAGKQSKESKKKASTGLKKLAKKMQDMMGMMSEEGESIDLEDLRQIRNSLNDFSKKQEDLNNRILRMNTVNPTFTAVIKEQKELQDKFVSVRDSLKSLGYKQPIITKIIGTELFHVETSMQNLFESYTANRANVVRVEQNKIMTEVNSIAVKLDELTRNMGQGKGEGKGKGQFTDRKKPKEGQQSGSEQISKTKSEQESMKEQLKDAIQKMKSGNTGKKGRSDLAKMLAQREMMRKAFEKVVQGGGLGKDAKDRANEALNMMKEVEKDIIYNRLGDQTLEKDNFIRTKLLDAENAEKERENENRRESKEFKGTFEPNKRLLEQGPEQNKAMEQMLKYNELKLKRFYQEKYQKYIESTKK